MVSSTSGATNTAMAISNMAPVRLLKSSWMGTCSTFLMRELAMATKMARPQQEKKYESEPEDIGADEELRFGFDQLLQLLLREVLVRGKQKDAAELDDHQATEAENEKDHEMHPRPGNAQVFGKRRACVSGRAKRGIGNGVAGERRRERFRRREFGSLVRCKLRGKILIGWFQRVVVEESHRFPGRDFLGQPAASAAATSGKSSSWWPVIA